MAAGRRYVWRCTLEVWQARQAWHQRENILGQVRPDVTEREELAGSLGAWVSKSMNMLKENMSETLWNSGAKNRSGDIAEERCVTKHVG